MSARKTTRRMGGVGDLARWTYTRERFPREAGLGEGEGSFVLVRKGDKARKRKRQVYCVREEKMRKANVLVGVGES